MNDRIVVFSDESSIATVLPVCRELGLKVMFVYDPHRKQIAGAISRITSQCDEVVAHPEKPGRADFIETIRGFDADFGLICSYGRILWRELLEVFPNGVANVHGGRLPQYRGANVLQWQIINGEPEIDVTLHYVDEGVDTGPVIGRRTVSVTAADTAVTVRDKCSSAIVPLLREWLPKLEKAKVLAEVQDERLAQRWPRRHPEDGMIDWSWSDRKISNLTRALVPPWPPVYYLGANGERTVLTSVLSEDAVRKLRKELGK